MKELFNINRFRFYLWVGLAFLVIGILAGLANIQVSFGEHVLNEIWHAIYILAINYWFFEYVVPRVRWRTAGLAILLIILQIFLWSWLAYAWKFIGVDIGIYTMLKPLSWSGSAVGHQMGDSIGSVLFFGIIKHIYNYRRLQRDRQRLQIEKQEAELNYLKSQTNPHFLFNTLNNIYSLSRDKSDLAPESIMRLSKILRFMLYEAGGQYIAIEQELKIIEDYIALEKLRYDESLNINYNYDVEDMKQSMPPLLLMPLVENAFKHGVSETRNRPFVDIHLSVNKRILSFVVKNSTDGLPAEAGVKENIGLSNLRRQLQLLYTDYGLNLQQNEAAFTATLKINLASHVQNQVYRR